MYSACYLKLEKKKNRNLKYSIVMVERKRQKMHSLMH